MTEVTSEKLRPNEPKKKCMRRRNVDEESDVRGTRSE